MIVQDAWDDGYVIQWDAKILSDEAMWRWVQQPTYWTAQLMKQGESEYSSQLTEQHS